MFWLVVRAVPWLEGSAVWAIGALGLKVSLGDIVIVNQFTSEVGIWNGETMSHSSWQSEKPRLMHLALSLVLLPADNFDDFLMTSTKEQTVQVANKRRQAELPPNAGKQGGRIDFANFRLPRTLRHEILTSGRHFRLRRRPWTRKFRLPTYDWTHHKLRNDPHDWVISGFKWVAKQPWVGECRFLPLMDILTPAASVSAWVSVWIGEWRVLLGVWSGRFNRKDPHFLFFFFPLRALS